MDDIHEDRLSVYEIGYLIADSVPEEKVPAEAEAVKAVITGAGATVIAEGAPHRERLAYTIRRKTLGGSYDKHDSAHFGWIKFEVGSDKIEAVKKAIEIIPSVIRMLLVSTVAENTYLGKRATAVAAAFGTKRAAPAAPAEEKKEAAPASIEEMDKSIDEMVKEV
jgi:ribosomal protein S6